MEYLFLTMPGTRLYVLCVCIYSTNNIYQGIYIFIYLIYQGIVLYTTFPEVESVLTSGLVPTTVDLIVRQ